MRKAWEEVEAKQARFAQYQRADIESGEGKGKTRAWGFVVDELEENGEPSAKRRRKSPSSWRSDFMKLTLSDFNSLSPSSAGPGGSLEAHKVQSTNEMKTASEQLESHCAVSAAPKVKNRLCL